MKQQAKFFRRSFLRGGSSGFTLIEILVVIGLIAVLATIVLVAVNPARQFKQARDTQRVSNVNAILNAVGQYVAENKGALPSVIPTSPEVIRTGVGGADLCNDIIPKYMPALPVDPNKGASVTNCGSYDTGYSISKDANDRILVSAIGELVSSISIQR